MTKDQSIELNSEVPRHVGLINIIEELQDTSRLFRTDTTCPSSHDVQL